MYYRSSFVPLPQKWKSMDSYYHYYYFYSDYGDIDSKFDDAYCRQMVSNFFEIDLPLSQNRLQKKNFDDPEPEIELPLDIPYAIERWEIEKMIHHNKDYQNESMSNKSKVEQTYFDFSNHLLPLMETFKLSYISPQPFSAGAFGQVYRAKDRYDRWYALKVISAGYKSDVPTYYWHDRMSFWRFNAENELICFDDLTECVAIQHTHLIRFIAFEWLVAPGLHPATCLVIQSELLHRSVHSMLRRAPFDSLCTAVMLSHIGSALDYLHRDCRIAHHDVKPENIMLMYRGCDYFSLIDNDNDDDDVRFIRRDHRWQFKFPTTDDDHGITFKLIDFGMATPYDLYPQAIHQTSVEHRYGTRIYFSPEKATHDRFNPYLSDTFALGMSAVEALLGEPFFNHLLDSDNGLFDDTYCLIVFAFVRDRWPSLCYDWPSFADSESGLFRDPLICAINLLLLPESNRMFARDLIAKLNRELYSEKITV